MSYNRIILHVDVNCAFLSWSAVNMLKDGSKLDIRAIPSVIGGDEKARHGIVLAKSESAKSFGIKTGETLFSARTKCPELKVFPANYNSYIIQSNKMYNIIKDYSPLIERYSIDECFIDYTGMEHIYGKSLSVAYEIQKRIFNELNFTVNIGIGPNKLLAKMAGELEKPNKINTLFQNELRQKLWDLPVGDLFMVGRMTEKVLINQGIKTIGNLAHTDPEILKFHLKSYGNLVWSYANGIDSSPVIPNNTIDPKSYSNSATMPSDITTRENAISSLIPLCESVAHRMRGDGFCCKNISIQIKYADFTTRSHQKCLKRLTNSSADILFCCTELFDKLWTLQPIRQLCVRLSDLDKKDYIQLSLFDNPKDLKKHKLDSASDTIKRKYGRKSLIKACMLQKDFSHLNRYSPNSEKPRTNCPF